MDSVEAQARGGGASDPRPWLDGVLMSERQDLDLLGRAETGQGHGRTRRRRARLLWSAQVAPR